MMMLQLCNWSWNHPWIKSYSEFLHISCFQSNHTGKYSSLEKLETMMYFWFIELMLSIKYSMKLSILGNKALFYGLRANTCFFMEPSEMPGCIPNRIYMDCIGISYFEFLSGYGVHRARPGIFTFPNRPLLALYQAPAPLDQLECQLVRYYISFDFLFTMVV